MTYLDPIHRDISDLTEAGETERFVFLGSRRPLPLRAQVGGEGPAPEDGVHIQVFRGDTGSRLGQFLAYDDGVDDMLALFERPRRVGLSCREEYPGLVGQLVVLIPVSELADLTRGDLPQMGPNAEGDEAWRQSVPEPPQLEAGPSSGGGPAGGALEPGAPGAPGASGEPDLPGADEDLDEDQPLRFGAVHLGNVVRFEADREHPDDFVDEATDLFETALEGDLPPVTDRLMDELAAGASCE